MAKKEKSYNGWKNRQTWNVVLWIDNSEHLYLAARDFMLRHPESKKPYRAFICLMGLEHSRTADGYKWYSQALDYAALNEYMRELTK